MERALTCLRRASDATFPNTKPTTTPAPWVLTSWEIEIGESISRGGFGEVLKATWLGHTIVAVKRLHMRLETQKLKEDFLREVKTWFPLRHPNIVPLLGACATAERPFMVAPYMSRGHALQYLESVGRDNVEVRGCKLLYEVSLGMQYLHARGVVHGDLKAVNVLIDEHCTAYVADFGFATLKQFSSTRHTTSTSAPAFGGTLRWMSPERLQGAKLTPPVDIYAFAMTAYEVLSEGDVPYTETPDALLFQHVVNNHLWRLMGSCWAPDPLARPSFSGISVGMKSIAKEAANVAAAAAAAAAVAKNVVTGVVETQGKKVPVEDLSGDSGVTSMSSEGAGGSRGETTAVKGQFRENDGQEPKERRRIVHRAIWHSRRHPSGNKPGHGEGRRKKGIDMAPSETSESSESDDSTDEVSDSDDSVVAEKSVDVTSAESEPNQMVLKDGSQDKSSDDDEDVHLQFEPGTWGAWVYNLVPILPTDIQKEVKAKVHKFALQLHQEDVKLEGEGVFIDFIQDLKKAGAKAKGLAKTVRKGKKDKGGISFRFGSGPTSDEDEDANRGSFGSSRSSGNSKNTGKLQEDLTEMARDLEKGQKEVQGALGIKGWTTAAAAKPKPFAPAAATEEDIQAEIDAEMERLDAQEEALLLRQQEVETKLNNQLKLQQKQLQIQEQEIRLRKKELELAAQEESLRGLAENKTHDATTFDKEKLHDELEEARSRLRESEAAVREKEREIRNQEREFQQQMKLQEQERRLQQKRAEKYASRHQREEARQRKKEDEQRRKDDMQRQKDAMQKQKEARQRQQEDLQSQMHDLQTQHEDVDEEPVVVLSRATEYRPEGRSQSNTNTSSGGGGFGFAGFWGSLFGGAPRTSEETQRPTFTRAATQDPRQSLGNLPSYSSRQSLDSVPAPPAPPVPAKPPSFADATPASAYAAPVSAAPTSAVPTSASAVPTSASAVPTSAAATTSATTTNRKPFVIRFL
ncbi:hypothetical protein BDR26DRAFT_686459 [Obelidium mucronatum]|nr:hypothetical protein BDR26DRAFT_686459 [Obelidium mucronatum]